METVIASRNAKSLSKAESAWWASVDLSRDVDIILPHGITVVKARAFEGYTGVRSIKLPATIVSIEERAFKDCTNIVKIIIPCSVTAVARDAFAGWTASQSIVVEGGITQTSQIGGEWRKSCSAKIELL